MSEKKIWAGLLHLGTNMWPKTFSDFRDFPDEEPGSRLFFDEDVWRDVTEAMSAAKMNAVVIDLAEGVRYPSHPELAVRGSWTPERLQAELARLRGLGLEPIPKLNFSAGHDAWLGEYSRMVSTPAYYRVCRDLIRDVAEMFERPRFFHMGYDEETESVQSQQDICIIRRGDLWWHDFNFFVREITSHGMRPWMWSDYAWGHPEDFFRRMTKEVVQSVWYYGTTYDVSKLRDADKQERYWKTKIKTYDKLEAAGFDQIPCGSNYSNDVNFGLTVDYCRAHLSPARLKGFLMASWFFTTKGFRERHLQSVRQVAAAMAKVVSCLLVSLMAVGSAVAEDARVSFAEPNIVPRPQSIFVETNRCVRIDAATPVSVACGTNAAAAVTRVRASFKTYFGFEPSATPCSGPAVSGGPEAYRLTADAAGIRIEANAENGVAYALSTLRQSAIAARGTLKTTGYVLPGLRIEDAPALAFRGIHFCWFPGVTARQMERYVRMAAYYKFNHVVIEPWGVFKWRRHPAFCWPDAPVTADDMRRLARLGRELGVTLVPQLNVFGHAAMSRFVGGKHATLDFGREYEPVFEPLGGWNWCLTNPETRRILLDMADELLAAFESPPYFHIGCDEAEEPSCPSCRAVPYAKLVTEHITAVRNHLVSRGARPLMWHDMLLDSADGRWKGFYARGNAATATMADALPRDVVVCDWYYGGPAKAYPTLVHFREKGFETLTCPWMNLAGIAAQAAEAKRLGLKGLLATTWNRAHGRPFAATLIADAHAGWGTSPARYEKSYGTIVCAGHLRQIGWDMGLTQKEETGFVNEDVPSKTAVGTVSD